MKKGYVLGLVLLLLLPAVHASIYDVVSSVKANPNAYSLVIGGATTSAEIKAAAELAGALGVTDTRLDTEVTARSRLIVFGSPEVNILTEELFGAWTHESRTVIVSSGTNLLVAGADTENTQRAVDVLKEFESNKNKLQEDLYVVRAFFAPDKSDVLLLAGIVVFILAAIVILILVIRKKIHKKEAVQPVQPIPQKNPMMSNPVQQPMQPPKKRQVLHEPPLSPQEHQAISYIQTNIMKGYTKEVLRESLHQQGWTDVTLDRVFKHVR